ncbi:MAG: hypothetical protein F6K10_09845 [Moorea sp. SIO2B7]|nr:hypothetical protein [Moorena sp. SIO2B7]
MTDTNAHNQKVLTDLAWAIEADAEAKQFALHFLECDYVSLREQEIEKLDDICDIPLTRFVVAPDAINLYTGIQAQIEEELPQALQVMGLESVTNLEQLLKAINFAREEFRKNCPFPVVIWINSEIRQQFAQFARDFQNWAAAAPKLLMSPASLIEELERKIELLMEGIGAWGPIKFLPTEEILGANYRFEAQVALKSLEEQDFELTPNILATKDFVEGRRLYAIIVREGEGESQSPESNAQTDVELQEVIELFKSSLQKWQEVGEKASLFCAIAHYHLALCYDFAHTSSRAQSDSELGIGHFRDCLALLREAQRQTLLARFCNGLGEFYQKLHLWEDLEALTAEYLPLHQQGLAGKQDLGSKVSPSDTHLPYIDQILLAQDYSFLAQIAWHKQRNYDQAVEQMQLALDTITQVPEELQIYYGHYWLLLAQIQDAKGYTLKDAEAGKKQNQMALESQKQALASGAGAKPQLLLAWLEELRQTYFEHQYYLDAYRTKLEIKSLQQQYGLIGFIGASRIRAIQSVKTTAKNRLAQEIAASGRQHDVNRLISQIDSTKDKLIIVYGQSGVGKSSLMEGGFVPALQQKGYLRNRDLIPIYLRVYTDWVAELGKLLGLDPPLSPPTPNPSQEGKKRRTSHAYFSETETRIAPDAEEEDPPLSPLKRGTLRDSPQITFLYPLLGGAGVGKARGDKSLLTESIINKLEDNAEQNYTTVLIFDQFEELFFVYQEQQERVEFFSFLAQCLEIRFVKVILSLREDYLYLLLDATRIVPLTAIGNDILKKDNLYYIGNFSSEDASNIIQQLTQRAHFFMESQLIERLVADLGGYPLQEAEGNREIPLNSHPPLTPPRRGKKGDFELNSPQTPLLDPLLGGAGVGWAGVGWARGAKLAVNYRGEQIYQVRPIELQIVGARRPRSAWSSAGFRRTAVNHEG